MVKTLRKNTKRQIAEKIMDWLMGVIICKLSFSLYVNYLYMSTVSLYVNLSTLYGNLPTVTKSSDVFKRCVDLAERGDLESIKVEYSGYYIRCKSTLQTLLKFDIDELNSSCGVWISGPPRCGKDFAVRNLHSVFVKSINKWWDGYRNEKHVLISDVEPDHCKWLSYFSKIWADRYPFTAEVKGGFNGN